ncbi:MAG: hypothetical protein IPO40_24630 [Fibrobacteres bacterium]|nr:hypothetical protein [Fibrobacterota bacterium]
MATKSVKSLSKQLAGVAKQAKSLGINTSKADAMVKQTKREGSKSFSGSSEEKAYLSSIPAQMTPETPANIPTLTSPDIGNVVGQNNTALSSVLGDTDTTYDATKGQFVTAPATTTPATDNYKALFDQATQMGNAAFDEMGTSEQRLAQLEKENKLKQKQQAVNETTGQINAVVAQSQAQQLALEGQGRGQTSGFIGGEQARINREAAIAALPLQAKLAAEQGALDLAQNHIDKMFQVQSNDALAKYQYKSKLIESVYSFATGQEQRRLDAIKAKEDRAYDEQRTNLAYQRSLASEAASYGLGGVSASILKLDPKSATFNQDIAGLQGRVMKPVVASGPAKRDTQFDKDGNLVDMQTGEILSQAGGGAVNEQKQQQIGETLSLARELLKDDGEWMSGKQSAVGASLAKLLPFGMSLGLQGNRTAFENKVNTLKANLTLDNLSLLKGPMSDKDLAFLQAIGSSISTNMSEKEFNGQVKKVIQKLEEKVAPVSLNGGRVITAPDGLQIEIID